MASPYPTVYQIEEMFHNRDTPSLFNTYLADNPDITVVGQDFHMAGNYRSTQAFHDEIYGRMPAFLKEETIRTEVLRVIGGGESAWAAVESVCTAEAKSEESPNYRVEFVDLVRFDSKGKISQMREFFDSGHIHGHLEHHHKKSQGDERK